MRLTINQGRRLQSGFTLIELMIVVAIMSTILALVGPNLFNIYYKAQYRSEVIQVQDTIKKLSYKAFINARPIELKLDGMQLSYHYQDESLRLVQTLHFEHIGFPSQSIIFSQAGFADSKQIMLLSNSYSSSINLTELMPF